MTSGSAYGEKLVNFMLKREKVFIPFQSCYYLLYQCLVPNTREALSLLVQHYSVPKDAERSILSGENPRVCNQGILNYLLIVLRTDKDFVKFWNGIRSMINHPELRMGIERIQKSIHASSKGLAQSPLPHHHRDVIISNRDDHSVEATFPLDEGAMADNDDDYCISYTVTMVDVRSCTRPPRSPGHPPAKEHTSSVMDEDVMSSLSLAQQVLRNNSCFAELQSHYSVLVRSMPDDYMNTVSQLERHLTGDHIGSILECSDVFTANQRILDSLIVQLDKKEDVFDLCDKLSVISDTPSLTVAIEDLKKDVIISLKSGDMSNDSTNGVTVETSLNVTPNNLSNSISTPPAAPERRMVPSIFSKLSPNQFGPKALAVLKKHYHALWQSFPDDHMITLTTLCEELKVHEEAIEMVTRCSTSEEANRTILDYVIFIINGDQHMNAFCDLMAKLINNPRLSRVISSLRRDCMDVTLQHMMQSMLLRRPLTSTNSAKIEELPSTFSEDVAVVTSEPSTTGNGPPHQDGGDIGASVIDHLPAGVSVQCRTMLRSHYDTLWQSFPKDHLITLSRLCDLLPVDEGLVETIALYPISDHDVANRRVLNAALSNVKHDNELLGFCALVEKLIENPDKAKMMEKLRSDCLKVMQKKEDLVKPSLTQTEQEPAVNVIPVDTVAPAKKDEADSSEDNDDGDDDHNDDGDDDHNDTTHVAADNTVRLLDSDPLVLHVLPSTVSADAIAVLRKYYNTLLTSLPDDHVTSVSILSETIHIDEVFFEEIISLTDHHVANEKILNAAIMLINRDSQMKGFCQLVKLLIRGECEFSSEIMMFQIECFSIEDKATKGNSSTTNVDTTSSVAPTETTSSSSGSDNNGTANSDDTNDINPVVFQKLSFSVSPECRMVLKKYYNFLWRSLPKNHLQTLERFSSVGNITDEMTSAIMSADTPEEGNRLMLHIAMVGVNKDVVLIQFYHLWEKLIDNPKLSKIVKVFKLECETAIEKCLAKMSSSTSTANVNHTTQSTSQVNSATSNTNTEPDVESVHRQETKSEGSSEVTPADAVDKDSETELFTILSTHQLSDNGITVLKKHYSILLKSLPSDHMVTLGRLCKIVPLNDQTFDQIISSPDSCVGNKKILHLLILMIENDNSILDFCNSLETILQDMPTVLVPLRSDCLRLLEPAEEAPSVQGTVNDTPAVTSMPQQSSVTSNNLQLNPTTTSTDNLRVQEPVEEAPSVQGTVNDTLAVTPVPQQSSSNNVQRTPTTASTGNGDDHDSNNETLMNVFSHIPPNLLNPKVKALLKKYYFDLWRAFPEDYMTSLAKLSAVLPLQDDIINLITSQSSSIGANKALLDTLIIYKGYNRELMEFCSLAESIIANEQKVVEVVEPLRNECLELMIEHRDSPVLPQPISLPTSDATVVSSAVAQPTTSSTSSPSAITETTAVKETTSSQQNAMATGDCKAALRAFDEHLHLMTLIEPSCIQESFQTSGLLATNDSFTSTPSLPSSTVMENVLKEVRHCIELNGAAKFIVFLNILQSEGRYVVLGCHIFNKYKSYGGHGLLTIENDPLLSAVSMLPIQQLLEQLRWHQKQILAGLQYQCPVPLPDYYIQRDQLLETIINKLTENDSMPTVGTTVTISGVGGVGKSTLAKALCHDLRIRNHFLDGFLWIRLGPLPVSPAIKLGQLYHLLTNRTEVGGQSFFTDKLQSLISNHLHKLLVIIDDVWEVSDALVYTQVFTSCNIVMTTRRENVNKLIPSKMCITIERMNEEEAVKLLTYNLSSQVQSESISQLAQDLLCWPMLLNLVNGQLSICINEQNKSLSQATDQIKESLKDKGLNAFGADKRRSAVVAAVESSTGLLSVDEMSTLQKLVLSAGFSMPVPIALLPAMLKVSSQVDRLCRRLLQLRLISNCQFVTAPNSKAIPCYEIHPIIAQYIMDHMTFKSPVELTDALDLGDISTISTMLAGGDNSNVSYHCLATVTAIDAVALPNHIRSLFTLIKCLQHEIKNCIIELSVLFIRGSRMDLTHLAMNFKDSDAVKCVEKLHQAIREDCKRLQSLLVSDNHEQATEWITNYVKNHPLRKVLATFTAFVKDLLNKCQNDNILIAKIKSHTDKIVLFYKNMLQKHSEHVKVTLRRGLVAMISSGNITSEQYKHLLDVYSTNLKLATARA